MGKMDENLCTTRQAADLLGVSLRTVQLWVESGVLRAWKTVGGHRRILRSSVQKLLDDRQRAIGIEPQAPDLENQGMRILVVEDEPDLLRLYKMHIAELNLPIQVIAAENGFDGLIRIGETRPDLLITDLNMPGIDGFEMIRSLYEGGRPWIMDIIVVTALDRYAIAARGGLPPEVMVYYKPVPYTELGHLIRQKFETLKSSVGAARVRAISTLAESLPAPQEIG